MGLIAVPNVSEGRDARRILLLAEVVRDAGASVADIHSDPIHHRSVLTVGGEPEQLVAAMTSLADTAGQIDLTQQEGAHPRLGGLDVCPFVPHGSPLSEAVELAVRTGRAISETCGSPVYLYGAAATRAETRELPSLRKGGLATLARRAGAGLEPDFGPSEIDPRRGVVCVGARSVLIAFNVWIESTEDTARAIAAEVRTRGGGLPGVRALGMSMSAGVSQVSMNLIEPERTGIDDAYDAVKAAAERRGVALIQTELVGVPPERYMPDPKREAARLLMKPGRSLENALAGLPPGRLPPTG